MTIEERLARHLSKSAGHSLEALARACDRPYAQAGTAAAMFFSLGALLLMMFLVK